MKKEKIALQKGLDCLKEATDKKACTTLKLEGFEEISNIITKAFNLLSYELRDIEVSVFDKVLDEKADEMKKFINRYIGQYIEWQKVAMRMLKGDDDQWKPK